MSLGFLLVLVFQFDDAYTGSGFVHAFILIVHWLCATCIRALHSFSANRLKQGDSFSNTPPGIYFHCARPQELAFCFVTAIQHVVSR